MKFMIRLLTIILLIVMAATYWPALHTASEAPVSYRTDKVTRGDIMQAVTATGALSPVRVVNVGTQVSGQVNHLYANVNDTVKKDQLLAEIDPALLLATLKQSRSAAEIARVNFDQASRDVKRTQWLLQKDYVAKADLEHAQQSYLQAKNSYDSAKTQVEHDEVNLNYTKIISPIDGVVISREVALGETMAASFQTPNMFKIATDLTQMKIDVNFSEADISKVKKSMPVTFTVDAFPDREFTGIVDMININPNSQQQGSVTYTVVVLVDNKDKALFPGMTAYVSVVLSQHKNILRVPVSALRFIPPPPPPPAGGLRGLLQSNVASPSQMPVSTDVAGKTLYIMRNGVPTPVAVQVGATDETFTEVSGPINEGDIVATGVIPVRKH